MSQKGCWPWLLAALLLTLATWVLSGCETLKIEPMTDNQFWGWGVESTSVCDISRNGKVTLTARCVRLSKPGDKSVYFGLFGDDGKLAVILKSSKERNEIIWKRKDGD